MFVLFISAAVEFTSAANGRPAADTGFVTGKMSASKIALRLVRERGVLGLYRGCRVTAFRDITFSAIYFPLFANLNKLVSESCQLSPRCDVTRISLWSVVIWKDVAGVSGAMRCRR